MQTARRAYRQTVRTVQTDINKGERANGKEGVQTDGQKSAGRHSEG